MSVTTYGVNDTLSNKLWAKKLNVEALKQTYFGKFMGEGSDNMIQLKMEHSQSAGDSVTVGLRVQLTVTESRSEEHTSELQSTMYLVCRLLLEKKKIYEMLSPGNRLTTLSLN